MSPTTPGRGSSVSSFALELEGVLCGFLKFAAGGGAAANIVIGKPGLGYSAQKQISSPHYGDFQIGCGPGMSQQFFEWIKASLGGVHTRKNGSIISLSYDLKELERRDFTHAQISGISFPACDASSKDPAFLTVSFKPEVTQFKPGNNSPVTARRFAQKQWTMNNFRLAIPGFDCSKVSQVGALQVKTLAAEVPNLVITMPEAHAQPFHDWHNNFVIKGKTDSSKEGSLTYLTPDLKTELFTISFQHLGIFKLTADNAAAHNENIRRVSVEMDTDRIALKYSPAAWA